MPPMKFGKHFKSETYLQKFCLIAFCLSAVVQGSLSMLWTKPWGKLGKYCRVLLRYRFKVQGGNDGEDYIYFAFFNVENLKVQDGNIEGYLMFFLMSLAPFCPGCEGRALRDLAHYWWNHRQHEAGPRCLTIMLMLMLIRRSGGWRWSWGGGRG